MTDTLFDKSLFANTTEPLPNQVFQKNFDAYFFLQYPQNELTIDTYSLFGFLNNLQENTIFVSNSDENITFKYQNLNWQLSDFHERFKEDCLQERFLFWESENDQWAMVSDAKKGIAVLGVDWKIASQVNMFYASSLLSPKQVLEKLNLEEHEAIFLRNYAPSEISLKRNQENPIWVKYYFECRVESENDKLFYWKQFEPLHLALTQTLKRFKGITMYANQAFWRRYKMRGTVYSSGKNAAVGGWQSYSYDNCKKVATKFLSQNTHLELLFEGKKEEAEQLYWANKNGLIGFMNFWVYANIEKTKVKGHYSDFHFLMGSDGDKATACNQRFEFSYKKSLIDDDTIADLVQTLIKIGFAKKIYRIEQPYVFANYKKDKVLEIEGMYSLTPDLENPSQVFSLTQV